EIKKLSNRQKFVGLIVEQRHPILNFPENKVKSLRQLSSITGSIFLDFIYNSKIEVSSMKLVLKSPFWNFSFLITFCKKGIVVLIPSTENSFNERFIFSIALFLVSLYVINLATIES